MAEIFSKMIKRVSNSCSRHINMARMPNSPYQNIANNIIRL